ncbi:amino acid:polyamine antiporter [Actinosynnema pretiosum]|uniref:Amino acid:polyamine antiporter n=1 Tax=Actinosynnema pretiosum TaxID=42197 RepID=A0A290Z8Z8_9PSEU|nr:amino acid:polyamine antiporter [Actinosynnema pretiosum]ATE55464.1 amino acid:polyamine antiporter [Actinosynnema pretiosum]
MTGPAAVAGGARRIAAHLSGGVLGAAMLVMPPVVAALTGGRAPLVWAAHVALGGAVALVLAELVRARVPPAALAGAVGALLGPWAARVVDGVFAVAFTAGQAAIAWFAATCLLAAPGGALPEPGVDVLLVALAVLVVAVLAALSPFPPPPSALRLRPWVTGALALACVVLGWPGAPQAGAHTPFAPTGLPPGGAVWLALAALFFAGVGWESVTSVVPAVAAGARRTAGGVALGVAAVAVVYVGLSAAPAATTAAEVPGPLRWALAVALLLVLTSYCFTNVRAAARITARLHPDWRPGRVVVAVVGLACCAFACAGARDGAVPLLLLGPAAAALVGYALAAVAAVRRGGPALRCAGAALLLVLVAFLPAGALLTG